MNFQVKLFYKRVKAQNLAKCFCSKKNLIDFDRFTDFNSEIFDSERIADKQWATSNLGKRFLVEFQRHDQPTTATDMPSFLERRGLKSNESSALRVLSSLTTFPLTISYGMKRLFNDSKDEVCVLIVGARAEVSMLQYQQRKYSLIKIENRDTTPLNSTSE